MYAGLLSGVFPHEYNTTAFAMLAFVISSFKSGPNGFSLPHDARNNTETMRAIIFFMV
jgi:hypothetical protein